MLTTEAGAGRPMIFVPGWLATSAWWHHQVDHFATGYRTITVDYGWGSCRTVDDCADTLARILDALGEPAILVGWSLGAAIALRLVELSGTETLASLVLVDQTPRSLAGPDWSYGVTGLDAAMLAGTPMLARQNLAALAAGVAAACFATPPEEATMVKLCAEGLRWSPEVAALLIADHWARDYRMAAAKIDVPTLLVRGDRSAFTSAGAMRYLNEAIGGSRLQVMAGCGHAPFIEAPAAFNRKLEQFLASDVHG